jgi:hypothetical protein
VLGQSLFHNRLVFGRQTGFIQLQGAPHQQLTLGDAQRR